MLGLHAAVDRLQLAAQVGEAPADDAAVGLDLGLTGASRPDATGLPLQVRPHAGQAREQVLVLGQLDLQARLLGARVTREDVEDELGAIDDLHVELLFEVAPLGGGDLVVHHHEVGSEGADHLLELLDLALAQERTHVGTAAALLDASQDLGSRRLDQTLELLEVGEDGLHPRTRAHEVDADEDGAFGLIFQVGVVEAVVAVRTLAVVAAVLTVGSQITPSRATGLVSTEI